MRITLVSPSPYDHISSTSGASSMPTSSSLEAVTPHKQRKIAQVAKGFLTQHRIKNRDCRFDVVGIKGDPNAPKTWQIELVPDAFRL